MMRYLPERKSLFDDMFAKIDSILLRCGSFSTAISNIVPQSDNVETATTENAEKSIGSLNKIIEGINNQRINFMNTVKPNKQKKNTIFENSSEDIEGEKDNEYE